MCIRLALLLTVLCGAGAAGGVEHWEDPLVNSENRLPSRTRAVPLADERAALTDALEFETPYVKSLNGRWKVRWSGTARNLRTDFAATDFDDSRWQTVDVPSCLELRGFGVPIYTNVEYPHGKTPPVAEERNNPVADYRTRFTVPETWKGRRVILRFDGIAAAGRIWVNGRYVGYTEDSKLTAEFDVTDFLNLQPSAANLLCVQVIKWPDGSFLEDQDMFRYHGIIRDVALVAEPKDGIWDFAVRTRPVDGCESWSLELELENGGSASLYDANGKKVGDLNPISNSNFQLQLKPCLWSAEDPYLYTLVLKKGDDIRAKRVGFKTVEIRGNVLYVNGAKVKFHGVNRHETNPDDGRTVTKADMIRDAEMMKQANIDTVRTSHYPDHPLWYDICDRYGIYVVAEANVEGNGVSLTYDKCSQLLGCLYDWEKPIVERNVNQVLQLRNHPSVVMWSLGNESGAGPNFVAARAAVKALDDRPVHYEGGNEAMDVDSTMYSPVELVHQRGEFGAGRTNRCDCGYGDAFGRRHSATKPYFMCEYAHAMNNAVGNLQEYWDEFYAYDCIAGGCIWDWVDQAIWKTLDRLDENGEPIRHLAFGGDFDDRPNLAGFCCNGLVDAERHWTAKLDEVKYVFAPIRLKGFSSDGSATLVNHARFTSSDAYDGTWEILVNGEPSMTGSFAVPAVAPASERRVKLPVPKIHLRGTDECFITYRFRLKADTPWAKKGHVVAAEQFALDQPVLLRPPPARGKVEVAEDERSVTVSGERFKAVFCRATGTLSSLAYDGVEMLAKGNVVRGAGNSRIPGPHLTCAYAFTDNTNFLREPFFWAGLTQLHYTCEDLTVTCDDAGAVVAANVTVAGARRAGFAHKATFRVAPTGIITVENEVAPVSVADMPQLPREGFTLMLADALENVAWYGRGPRENYIDRCRGSFLGAWTNTVTGLAEPYSRPQDTANVTDVRSYALTDAQGRGIVFKAVGRPFAVRCLRSTWEELEFARHRPGWERIYNVKPPRKEVIVDIDFLQVGLGGGSCGPTTLEKYLFKNEPRTFTYVIAPAK